MAGSPSTDTKSMKSEMFRCELAIRHIVIPVSSRYMSPVSKKRTSSKSPVYEPA